MSGHPPHALCAASYDAAVVCASAYCSEWATAVRYLARTTQRLDNGCAHIISPSPSPSLQPTDPPPPPRCLSQRGGRREREGCMCGIPRSAGALPCTSQWLLYRPHAAPASAGVSQTSHPAWCRCPATQKLRVHLAAAQ
ncbi:hypothetical protein B0H14DRAFT_3444723 [Mycena olivaceomarginata]|nr:hypothetical protein B0H14DRAFT_3444723 [Mycena olivaceomarginata]